MARGDVLLVSLPDSDKREEKGNRPAIAVQTDIAVSPMLMVVPVTSSLGALRFPFTVNPHSALHFVILYVLQNPFNISCLH